MIEVDISNIWGQVALPELLAMEDTVAAAHSRLFGDTPEGLQTWPQLPGLGPEGELSRILNAAEKIRGDSEICVVIALGGASLGSRAIVEAIRGPDRNLARGKPALLYAGSSLSTRGWNDLQRQLDGKDFSLIVISKSGTDLESAVALRGLRWMLERKYGTDEARGRIYAVTDPAAGALDQMVRDQGWTCFTLPTQLPESLSLATAAGLLPMAVAGLDIAAFLRGIRAAGEDYRLGSFENPLWLYAAARNLLARGGREIELFATFEPGLRGLGAWWQQLFAQCEGEAGLFPVAVEYPGDLACLGRRIQRGRSNLFETLIRFDPPEKCAFVDADWKNRDGLGCIEGKPWDWVEDRAFEAAVTAHTDGGVPVIAMSCGSLEEENLGQLCGFLELAGCLSAGIQGLEPFEDQADPYRQSLDALVGRSRDEEG